MAQKDKVKELVGRGLDSYHTKALQQIDRINKKNREQNHKISILTNELDNDYLTKTEEGSVISLEHSKEGMVYLDELQGNTLVNYCTDGAKELTLNGNIDAEGTNVTTTEGVDNGKVDVMCEGNTLVNLATIKSVTLSNTGSKVISNLTFKQDTKYTLIFDVDSNSVTNESHEGIYLWFTADGITPSTVSALDLKGRKKYVMTRSDNANGWGIGCRNDLSGTVILNNILILEGDWTNRELPTSYFEGMKSVGQDDTNGHKIEILSRNKNLIRKEYFPSLILNGNHDGMTFTTLEDGSVIAKGTPTKSITQFCNFNYATILKHGVRYNAKDIGIQITKFDGTKQYGGFVFDKNTMQKVEVYFQWNKVGEVYDEHRYPMFAEDTVYTSDYIQGKINKKEILMNEPLRGLPNGVKDRFVKIGGKWYIERNTEELDMGSVTFSTYALSDEHPDVFGFYYTPSNIIQSGSDNRCICNILPSVYCAFPGIINHNIEGIDVSGTHIKGSIYRSKLTELSSNGLKKYFNEVGAKVLYPLRTPIYEPLEIEPTLNTYNDTTHISNNSIIPCTMKIQNSGYNAIIKPSTLYTVALDTNKSGTIGMNLGGTKGTTTNNVLTLTTPATLTDDSLRLYGKGIKGSRVRILEGDKTNWIPSHFEGMKSSFEDKFDATDNTYKMEILSNKGGMNLCTNSDDIRGSVASGIILEKVDDKGYKNIAKLSGNLSGSWFSVSSTLTTKISPNTTITISVLARTDKPNNQSKLSFYLGDGQEGSYIDFNEPLSNEYKWISQTRKFISNSFRPHFGLSNFNGHSVYISKMKIEFGNKMTEWCPSIKDVSWSEYENYNKIQFSSIEPLRGVGDYKDKFVFRNDKLMIQRNCKVTVLDETYNYSIWGNASQAGYFTCHANNYIQGDFNFNPGNTVSKEFTISNRTGEIQTISYYKSNPHITVRTTIANSVNEFKNWVKDNNIHLLHPIIEPTYEEIPFELQKIILEGYENGTLFFDTNIPPTSTITYAGETPIVKVTKLNKTEVSSNTDDINDNIVPYLMDMDYRVVCLQLQSEGFNGGIEMARLFGGTYEMLKRDIQSNRLSKEEYGYRLIDYFNAGKLTEEEVRELEDLK